MVEPGASGKGDAHGANIVPPFAVRSTARPSSLRAPAVHALRGMDQTSDLIGSSPRLMEDRLAGPVTPHHSQTPGGRPHGCDTGRRRQRHAARTVGEVERRQPPAAGRCRAGSSRTRRPETRPFRRAHCAGEKSAGAYSTGSSGFNWHFRMFSASGPPATWRGEECFASLGSASHTAMFGHRSGEGGVAGQVAEVDRRRRLRRDDLGLAAHGVERLLRGADRSGSTARCPWSRASSASRPRPAPRVAGKRPVP